MKEATFVSSRLVIRAAAAGALLFFIGVQSGWAWGREGHRLTALVAEQYLSPETRAQVAKLLGKQTLADVAPWADEYRSEHPETDPWHFVDIPAAESQFDRNRDCPVSKANPASPWRDCITDRILYFEGRLGDASLSPADRAMALKFLVHFIGDIHQPFHALGDDRGGNDIPVTFMGSGVCGEFRCNLHGVWDDMLIEEQGLSEKKYTDKLLNEIKDNNWERLAGGEPTTWANISHHYAVDALVPKGTLIPSEYVADEVTVVDAQLALGGLRLARVLNRILGEPAVPAATDGQPKPDTLSTPSVNAPPQ